MARRRNSRWPKWCSGCCTWPRRPRPMRPTRWRWPWSTPRNRGVITSCRRSEYEKPGSSKFKVQSSKKARTCGIVCGTLHLELGTRNLELGTEMITFLHGKLIEALPTQVVVEVQGIGYAALIPLSSYDKLPAPGQEIKLLTHLAVREDAHILYGFMSTAERDLFRLLIHTVSGIGPKIALNVLSGVSVMAFRGAVATGDVKALSQISGVGRKTAERIVVELKDKIGAAGAWEASSAQRALSPDEQRVNDAVLALLALGFKQIEAHDSVRKAQASLRASATVEDLVRACLRKAA